MTDVLPQPDCSLKAVCEPLERCCLDPLEEPGSKRPPNTGARLWGRVRSKLLRQKVLAGDPEGAGAWRLAGLRGWGLGGCGRHLPGGLLSSYCLRSPGTELGSACAPALGDLHLMLKAACHPVTLAAFSASVPVSGKVGLSSVGEDCLASSEFTGAGT